MPGFDPDGPGANPGEAASASGAMADGQWQMAYPRFLNQSEWLMPDEGRIRGGRRVPLNHQPFTINHPRVPRGVIRSAPVSDTGGPGAKPGEAAN